MCLSSQVPVPASRGDLLLPDWELHFMMSGADPAGPRVKRGLGKADQRHFWDAL